MRILTTLSSYQLISTENVRTDYEKIICKKEFICKDLEVGLSGEGSKK